MSEYQYYEFLAIDRPLTSKEMDELRRLSTRAEITPTSFTNEYHWGDFSGDPRKMMWRYFDAFVYTANWGTHQFTLRLPRGLIDETAAAAYAASDVLTVEAKDEHVLVDFLSRDESGEWESDEFGQGLMSSLSPLRSELMAGDLRALYLGWLAAVGEGGLDEDDVEPPVPPGLGKLTGPLKKLAKFIRVDDDLLETAAEASAPAGAVPGGPSDDDLAAWLARLPAEEKDALLLRVAGGDALGPRLELMRRFRAEHARPRAAPAAAAGRRTVGQLTAEAENRERTRLQRQAQRREAERQRKAAERDRYLADLAGRQEQAWRDVESLVQTKERDQYDKAVELLKDLRDISDRTGAAESFAARVRDIRKRHATKSGLLQRMSKAALVTKSRAAT